MKVEINGKEYYFDKLLYDNIMLIVQAVKKNWDGVLYTGGYEGDGKSEFTEQLAFLVDNTYCLERCVFTPAQFIEAVNNAKPGEAIVYDEAQDAFESTAKDKSARLVKSLMTRIRKKNLYIFIVAPDFWRINKYMFIHRSRAFIRVYANGLERGYFEYYNRTKKHELMIRGKKNEHLCVPPNFRGRFTHWRVLDVDAYDAKKEEATQQLDEKDEANENKYFIIYKRLLFDEIISEDEKARISGYNKRTLRLHRAKYGKEAENGGGNSNKQLIGGVSS